MINRGNYEEYFLLYADKELSEGERLAVEEFVSDNPDLARELAVIQQLRFRPETNIRYEEKENLLRQPGEPTVTNINNYEDYFVSYVDNELSDVEKNMVDEFVADHPEVKIEFELMLITQVSPDLSVVFPDKNLLYRKPAKVVVFAPWMRIAAAVLVILLSGAVLFVERHHSASQAIAGAGPSVGHPSPVVAETQNHPQKQNGSIKSLSPVTSQAPGTLNEVQKATRNLAVNHQGTNTIRQRRQSKSNTTQQPPHPDTDVAINDRDGKAAPEATVVHSVQGIGIASPGNDPSTGTSKEVSSPRGTMVLPQVDPVVGPNISDGGDDGS